MLVDMKGILHLMMLCSASLGTVCISAQRTSNPPSSVVPFIGCPSDGQVGPIAAPTGHPKHVKLPSAIATRLAYYKGDDSVGVLAPRGWQCFSTYGSNGSSLFVAPQLPPHKSFFSGSWKGFSGSVIQISNVDGGTSGRFSVAQTIARVFPAHRAFAQQVLDEHLGLDKLPSGPYPTDVLRYRSPEVVEYTTPPNTDGLGTKSWLLKNGTPITGVEILQTEEPNAVSLAVRLPADSTNLAPLIIQFAEQENPPDAK
jgi:hypothetical protein